MVFRILMLFLFVLGALLLVTSQVNAENCANGVCSTVKVMAIIQHPVVVQRPAVCTAVTNSDCIYRLEITPLRKIAEGIGGGLKALGKVVCKTGKVAFKATAKVGRAAVLGQRRRC